MGCLVYHSYIKSNKKEEDKKGKIPHSECLNYTHLNAFSTLEYAICFSINLCVVYPNDMTLILYNVCCAAVCSSKVSAIPVR